eukprot:12971710-Ditylum_brightwellii.AAC.1
MSRLLPRLGYHQNFPHAVGFGPEKYGGIGLQSIPGEQAVAKITFVIKHLRAENEIGKTIRTTIQWAQVMAGTKRQILEDTRPIPHLEGTYISHLRE